MTTTVLTTTARPLFDEARTAVAGYLAGYPETTRRSYASDLRQYFAWCEVVGPRGLRGPPRPERAENVIQAL